MGKCMAAVLGRRLSETTERHYQPQDMPSMVATKSGTRDMARGVVDFCKLQCMRLPGMGLVFAPEQRKPIGTALLEACCGIGASRVIGYVGAIWYRTHFLVC